MGMGAAVTSWEWNRLNKKEKVTRTTKFCEHIESLPPQAPVDWSYLTSLAIMYQTPVPRYNNKELDWGEYR